MTPVLARCVDPLQSTTGTATTWSKNTRMTGVFKLDQELHLRILHRDLKQPRNLHSCLR